MSAFDKIIGQSACSPRTVTFWTVLGEALAKKRYLIYDDFKRIKADCVA